MDFQSCSTSLMFIIKFVFYFYFQKKVGHPLIKVNSKDAEDEMKDAENLENSFNSVGFIGQDISAILESTTEEIENSIVQKNSTKEDLENGIKPMEPNTPEVSENPETTMEDIENSIVHQENSTNDNSVRGARPAQDVSQQDLAQQAKQLQILQRMAQLRRAQEIQQQQQDLDNSNVEENSIKPKVGY